MFLSRSPVKIKGAGLKGLALAYFLKQQGIDSIIYEATDRAGGWVRSIRKEGFLFEAGPRGFRPNQTTLSLIENLGLTDSLIYPDAAAKKRFIYSKGNLKPVGAFFLPLFLGLIRDLILPKETQELTVRDYFDRRLGKLCTDFLIDPLTSGIYAGDINQLSAPKCFPSMTEKGSLLKSILSQPKVPLISFKEGMETLVNSLKKDQPIIYHNSTELCDVDCTPDLALPTVSVVAVNLGWRDEQLAKKGFGYLIPTLEREPILGAVFDSITFPSQNQYDNELRITVMMGGAHHPEMIDRSEKDLEGIALSAISKHLKINNLPDIVIVHKAREALFQPFVGSPLTGVGVNHAITTAMQVVAKLAKGGLF